MDKIERLSPQALSKLTFYEYYIFLNKLIIMSLVNRNSII